MCVGLQIIHVVAAGDCVHIINDETRSNSSSVPLLQARIARYDLPYLHYLIFFQFTMCTSDQKLISPCFVNRCGGKFQIIREYGHMFVRKSKRYVIEVDILFEVSWTGLAVDLQLNTWLILNFRVNTWTVFIFTFLTVFLTSYLYIFRCVLFYFKSVWRIRLWLLCHEWIVGHPNNTRVRF